MSRRLAVSLTTLIFITLLVGCATTKVTNRPTLPKSADTDMYGARAPHIFMPLNLGNTWTYNRFFLGETGELKVSIVEKDSDGFFHDDQGGMFKVTSFGVRDKDRYLLLAPLEAGQKWTARINVATVESFEIIEDNSTVTVPAGTFEHCLTVRSVTSLVRGVRMVNQVTYAPKVGMIRLETIMENNQKRKQRQTLFELASYTLP